MKNANDYKEELKKVASVGLTVSYKNLIYLYRKNNQWVVEYEEYFNPHTDPQQLMEEESFELLEDAASWFIEHLLKEYPYFYEH